MPLPQQMNNDIAAQMQDMMNKSPGNVNHFEDPNGLHMPPQGFGAIDDKIREFRNADLLHRGGDANNVMDDKNYEEGKIDINIFLCKSKNLLFFPFLCCFFNLLIYFFFCAGTILNP